MKKGLSVLSSSSAHAADSSRTRHRTLARWILTVVVLRDHFWHTRKDCLLHIPLIDVPWLFPSSSQDECSVLTRRALLSVDGHTRISVGNPDDLLTPRLFYLAAKLAALGHSGQALGNLFVKLSSQGVHFSRLLLALVGACTHLRLQRVCLSAHFAVPGSTPTSSVAERHARH